MDKLQMAHEWALVFTQHNKDLSVAAKTVSAWAFDYADAMQAEADKRNKAESEQKRKEIREILNAPNTFIESEGQHFDDVEEWQPDWSQAPDNLVQYFAVDESGRGGWFINKPKLCSDHWYWSNWSERDGNDNYDHAPSFGYQGNWQDSLRKRPQ